MEKIGLRTPSFQCCFHAWAHEADRAEAEKLFNSDGRLCRRSPHRPIGPFINGGLGWFGALQDTPQPAASCDPSPAQYSDWELKAAHWEDAALTCSADA